MDIICCGISLSWSVLSLTTIRPGGRLCSATCLPFYRNSGMVLHVIPLHFFRYTFRFRLRTLYHVSVFSLFLAPLLETDHQTSFQATHLKSSELASLISDHYLLWHYEFSSNTPYIFCYWLQFCIEEILSYIRYFLFRFGHPIWVVLGLSIFYPQPQNFRHFPGLVRFCFPHTMIFILTWLAEDDSQIPVDDWLFSFTLFIFLHLLSWFLFRYKLNMAIYSWTIAITFIYLFISL